jgi:hypothetical protein
MAQRGAGRGIGQPALERPQDSQRESIVRYFRGGAVGQLQGRRAAVPAPNTFIQEWANYIAARIKRAEDRTICACMAAVGEVIGKNVIELEKRCAALEAELAEMRDRETTRRLRAVPSSPPAALIA